MNNSGVGNKTLLFHGTKNCNLLSILGTGLKIKPPVSDHNGSMFGDGIYFADMFEKSVQYCDDFNFFGQELN